MTVEYFLKSAGNRAEKPISKITSHKDKLSIKVPRKAPNSAPKNVSSICQAEFSIVNSYLVIYMTDKVLSLS